MTITGTITTYISMTPSTIVMPPGCDKPTPATQPETQKPAKTPQNRKNRTPLNRLQYMREYNKRKKAEKLAFEYGYIKPEPKTPDEATHTGTIPESKALVTGNRERDTLLRELESLRRSGNDMAALAAIKAYAELAGISAQESKIGSLSPDQAIRYREAVQANLRASLDRGVGIVEVLTVDGYERIVGNRADALAAIDRLFPPDQAADTTTGSDPAQNVGDNPQIKPDNNLNNA